MSLLAANSAAMSAYRKATRDNTSVINEIGAAATKAGLSYETVAEQFEKLYPGFLHPLATKKG